MLQARANPGTTPVEHLFNAYVHSLTLTNPNLTLDGTNKTLSVRPGPNPPPTVTVISGSALTPSPYIASFVGPGLLTACIGCSSPVAGDAGEHVRIAVQERVLTSQRVLFIIPQAGEDECVVEDAALRAKRHDPTLQFEHLTAPSTLVLDPNTELQRPGAGLPLLFKICSATAAQGYSLEEVLRVGKLVVKNLLSVGSSARPDLHEGAASSPSEPFMSLQVRQMISRMLDPNLRGPGFVEVNSNEVVLHVSGQSGLTTVETGAITTEAVQQMQRWNIRPVRVYTDAISELSVMGREGGCNRDFTITILNVCNTDIGGPSMIQLLDTPAEAAGWTAFVKATSWEANSTRLWERNVQRVRPSGLKCDPAVIWRAATNGSRAVVAFAKRNKLAGGYPYESWYGDAAAPGGQNSHAQDIWDSAKGAITVLATLQTLSDDVAILMNDMLSAIAPALDNPFGALVTIFFMALVQSFRKQSETADEVNVGLWVYALEDAYQELSEYANHRPAMTCTLKVFDMFLQTLHSTGDVSKAAKAADQRPDTATDLGGRLLCAFLAGLAGPVNGKAPQDAGGEEKCEARGEWQEHDLPGEKVGTEAEPSSDARAGESLQADELGESLQKKGSPIKGSKKPEQPAVPANEELLPNSDEGSSSPRSPESPTTETAGRPGVIASLGAAPGPTSQKTTPKEAAAEQMVRTNEGQVTETSQDARADALGIKNSGFDATTEGIRSRERVPLPTRQIEETSLLDVVRQQSETLDVSSKEEVAAEKGADEEEYEWV